MPYIKSNDGRRKALQNGDVAESAGELNYQCFYYIKHNVSEILIRDFVDQFLSQGKNYQRYNDMTGALIRCYREVKRRLNYKADFLIEVLDSYDKEIEKYEDIKIIENGDVE